MSQPTSNTFSTPNGTLGTLNGLFKEQYANKLENLQPDGVKILKQVKFAPRDKQPGNLYHQPVILGLEHGVTFADSEEDAFSLQPPVAGQIKDAQVRGNPLVLRSVLGYSAASRAVTSTQAFETATKYLVGNMLRSVSKKLEIEMLYGQMGYGTVASATGAAVVITTAEWAPGIWAGAEKLPIEIRSADGSQTRGVFEVSSVNLDTRTLTLNANAQSNGVGAGDVIWHRGAYGKEFPGIHRILTQTTGSLFNINVADYNLFRGNQYSAGSGALSFQKLQAAAARAVEKGLEGPLMAMVSTKGWTNILSDQAALRMYDSSWSSKVVQNGSESIKFFSQNGEIAIEPSIYVKEGYAYLLSKDEWMRVGSSDLTFKVPGQGEEFFRHLENAAGYELRLWTDQAIFTYSPGKNTVITDVVNSAVS